MGLRGGPEEAKESGDAGQASSEDSGSGEEEEGEEEKVQSQTHGLEDMSGSSALASEVSGAEGRLENGGPVPDALQDKIHSICLDGKSDTDIPVTAEDLDNACGAEDELDDEVDLDEDLSCRNKQFRPFRNEHSLEHVNSHIENSRGTRPRSSDSVSSTVSTCSVNPELVKARVRRQMKQTQKQQEARRIRKRGEAGVVTKLRRDNRDNIKASLSPDWY